ncbi:hypothetical protein [Mumia zhuanghuii]|uniref:Uncharacterized protein n=1 Tax=Mumia zhuanghuii TaxID=2585211 RepID=A0A5C4LYK5_9ACTN|nr:hypothetical protein [Mumia zhuanghuii]TNC22040.1 hypothetical protein FHE65_36205 [Mumia zhuanghuii]TNC22183.1 hypothetical protein FHE65_35890 [Mumia zhuanghuii]
MLRQFAWQPHVEVSRPEVRFEAHPLRELDKRSKMLLGALGQRERCAEPDRLAYLVGTAFESPPVVVAER